MNPMDIVQIQWNNDSGLVARFSTIHNYNPFAYTCEIE